MVPCTLPTYLVQQVHALCCRRAPTGYSHSSKVTYPGLVSFSGEYGGLSQFQVPTYLGIICFRIKRPLEAVWKQLSRLSIFILSFKWSPSVSLSIPVISLSVTYVYTYVFRQLLILLIYIARHSTAHISQGSPYLLPLLTHPGEETYDLQSKLDLAIIVRYHYAATQPNRYIAPLYPGDFAGKQQNHVSHLFHAMPCHANARSMPRHFNWL